MAVYTTLANLQKRVDPRVLAQWADDTEGTVIRTQSDATTALAGATVLAIISQAITDASLVIDQNLFGQMDMDSATVQASIEPLCSDITLYYLARRRYLDDERNPRYMAYTQAIDRLRLLQEGKLHTADDPQSGTIDASSNVTTSTLKITTDTLRGW